MFERWVNMRSHQYSLTFTLHVAFRMEIGIIAFYAMKYAFFEIKGNLNRTDRCLYMIHYRSSDGTSEPKLVNAIHINMCKMV